MHFTALLALVTVLIPAVTPTPAALPQSAEIDIHLELNSKDLTGLFNGRKAKTDSDYDTAAVLGPSLSYPFRLKGHLEHGRELFVHGPTLYYRFESPRLGHQGILSSHPSTFRLGNGKLLLEDQAVGLREPFEKGPAPVVLINPTLGLNFTIDRPIGSNLELLRIVEPRFCEPRLIFQGPELVSGEGDPVGIDLTPCECAHSIPLLFLCFFMGKLKKKNINN